MPTSYHVKLNNNNHAKKKKLKKEKENEKKKPRKKGKKENKKIYITPKQRGGKATKCNQAKWFDREINDFSKIQLVVSHHCCVLIG